MKKTAQPAGSAPASARREPFFAPPVPKVPGAIIWRFCRISAPAAVSAAGSVIIAYEPIWSIGTGNVPNSSEVNRAVELIKGILPNNKIIYGGSVNSNNIADINENCNIDGYLLGKISLDTKEIDKFLKVI